MEGATLTALWYNKMGYDSNTPAPADALTQGKVNSVLSTDLTTPHYFYTYPNSTSDDHFRGPWQPRYTRLVSQ